MKFISVLTASATLIFSAFIFAETSVTPQPVYVDSDQDGVTDDIDACYETPLGRVVDERGCPNLKFKSKKVTLNVQFLVDSSVVRPQFYNEIKKVADFLKSNRFSRVIIEGHTDSDGTDAYNIGLSQRRSNSVIAMLVNRYGIDRKRLLAKGYGERRPLVPNTTKKISKSTVV